MTSRPLRMAYKDIPTFRCRPGCHDCCGPVPWSPEEAARVMDDVRPTDRWLDLLPGVQVLVSDVGACPFVSPAELGGCSVYDQRPFMCRLFGTAPSEPRLRCPHGCQPERPLSASKAAALTNIYRDIK